MSAIQQVMMSLGGSKPLPEFVSAGTTNRVSNNTTNTLPAPGTISDGNRLLAILVADDSSRTISAVPSGFSLVYSLNSYYVYEKTAASESGNYTFVWNANANSTGVVLCYENVSTILAGTAQEDSSATATAPSISPTKEGVLLQYFAALQNRTITTAPSGTQRAVHTGSSPSVALYEITPQAAGATGDKTLVWSNSTNVVGHLIQLTNE